MLGSDSRDFVSFILCYYKPSAGSISNHLNGIINTVSGGDAPGKIGHSAVIFGSVLIIKTLYTTIHNTSKEIHNNTQIFYAKENESILLTIDSQEIFSRYYKKLWVLWQRVVINYNMQGLTLFCPAEPSSVGI